VCARCGNYFCWDCGGENLDAYCDECTRHLGTLPWDRGTSPMSFLRTVWSVAIRPATAAQLSRSHDDAPLPIGFAALALLIGGVFTISVLVLVVLLQQRSMARFGVDDFVMTGATIDAARAFGTVPLNLVVRTALNVALLVALSRFGARTLSWRAALRSALFEASFATFAMIPVLGLGIVYLAPRFMLRVASVQRSVPQMLGLGLGLCVVWLAVGMIDQLVVDYTIGPWLQDTFIDWLMRRHRGGALEPPAVGRAW
jgi:hypothetical protein